MVNTIHTHLLFGAENGFDMDAKRVESDDRESLLDNCYRMRKNQYD